MADVRIDVTGKTCPVPLVEMRKAVRNASSGDIIEVKGTHKPSREEIPMAAKSMGIEVVSNEQEEDIWRIRIRV